MIKSGLVASKENMEFFFDLLKVSDKQIEFNMYSTLYTLDKYENTWINSRKNKFNMSTKLIEAVRIAINADQGLNL